MNRITVRSAVLLVLITLLTVGIAVTWQHVFSPTINLAQKQLKARTWLSVLPPTSYDNQPLDAPLALEDSVLAHSQLVAGYRATLNGQATAVVLHCKAQGYGGPLELLIAIDNQGRVIGTKVLRQQETPGLGARLVETGNHWLEHFNGASRQTTADASWAIKRDSGQFDQLAGATVTSRAVIHAVHDALRYFDDHRQRLLGEDRDE
ncbi:RnfABCDGE type electron transport complex subunit G [Pseudomonas alkylphenolica]|uniref:RnfABCDGE type electron transport complex subunit G n=1 Tax=Pseudomonas alkylphenolica TaxID=237609 RepID=UPI0018D7E0F1|nr:RnfABCDGE type electron transport complex subunit G [Pseudomonas alkylphenolica]MBH3430485.1 RnfABCDGE type electron transport complex subunit G [Pseudomonas alkylphenolica]